MKHKLSKLLVASLLVLTGCTFSPQGGGEHTHKYEVEWFWKQLQNKDYEARATFTCPECKEDVEGHSVTVNAEVLKETVRAATCTQLGEYKYSASVEFEGKQYQDFKTREYEDPSAHHYVEVKNAQYLVSAANCEDDAVYYKSCEHCGEASEETFVDVGSHLGHDFQHYDEKESTCQEHGNKEYYQCNRCQKYFLDKEGDPVSYADIELPLSHRMTFHPGTDATCTTDGTLGYYTCEYEPGIKYFDEAGERQVMDDADLYVEALGHEFGEDGECIRCDRLLRDEYGLVDPTLIDRLPPISIRDLGIEDETSVPTGTSHIFKKYDFVKNKGMDLWFEFSYEIVAGDTQLSVYLFNQYDESGARFRIETNRTENDGIAFGYFIYGSDVTQVIFPKTADIKQGNSITVHIFAYLEDATNNTFTLGYQAGTGAVYNPAIGGDGYEKDTPLFTKTITLGADYFANDQHNIIRFSGINNGTIVIRNGANPAKKVIMRTATNECLGVKTFDESTQFEMPKLHKDGYTFLGWFDYRGNKYQSFLVDGTYFLTARFIETQENMFVPSDAGFITKGEWVTINSNSPVEDYRPLPVSADSTRNDIYFILKNVANEGEDPYIVFGFPYDAIDAKTRTHARINFNKNLAYLEGYLFGTKDNSLGEAGPDNYFKNTNVLTQGYDLLVHLYVIGSPAGGLSFNVGIEVMNLGTGTAYTVETTNSSDVNFSTADRDRNMFCIKAIDHAIGSEFRITDAF